MIEGIVNEALEPIVEIGLKQGEAVTTIPVVVDTGFTGYLCLAERYVNQFDMMFAFAEPYELADGDIIVEDVFRGILVFDGREQEVDVILTASQDALIGASLLQDYRLSIDSPGRVVLIERA